MPLTIYPSLSSRLTHCGCYGTAEDLLKCMADIDNLFELGQLSETEYKSLQTQYKTTKGAMVQKIKLQIAQTEIALQTYNHTTNILQRQYNELQADLILMSGKPDNYQIN